jgi:hypothetical protein
MDPLSQLVARVDAYLERTGEHATGFGIKVLNNSALVPRMRSGNVTAKTMGIVSKFLDAAEKSKRKRKRKVN